MPVIAWQYLTGRAVATDATDRLRPEWPPHPDRVFQALVAAWGESGCDAEEAQALRWLAGLGNPELACPLEVEHVDLVRSWVPVNDIEGPPRGDYGPAHLQLLPTHRTRKVRQFPSVNVASTVFALSWPGVSPTHLETLRRVCSRVTYVGHSSSLVRMWVQDVAPPVTLRPTDRRADFRLRVSDVGRFDELVAAFAGGGPGWHRPPTARWQAYETVAEERATARGDFDDRMLVFRRTGGMRVGLAQAPAMVSALRGLLIAAADQLPLAKRLVSGHEPDGAPLRCPHVAIVPLAFVGDPARHDGGRHGDGHVMGVALAMPKAITPDEEQELQAAIAGAFRGSPNRERALTLGGEGVVSITLDIQDAPAQSLRPATWSRASSVWGSITPVALDRSTPRRHADQEGWAREQVVAACLRQNLPAPIAVEVLPVSPWLGAPSAREMPALMRKEGTRRWHIHALLVFPRRVTGPLVIGAGRYRGYGFFGPMSEGT